MTMKINKIKPKTTTRIDKAVKDFEDVSDVFSKSGGPQGTKRIKESFNKVKEASRTSNIPGTALYRSQSHNPGEKAGGQSDLRKVGPSWKHRTMRKAKPR